MSPRGAVPSQPRSRALCAQPPRSLGLQPLLQPPRPICCPQPPPLATAASRAGQDSPLLLMPSPSLVNRHRKTRILPAQTVLVNPARPCKPPEWRRVPLQPMPVGGVSLWRDPQAAPPLQAAAAKALLAVPCVWGASCHHPSWLGGPQASREGLGRLLTRPAPQQGWEGGRQSGAA